MHVFVDVAARIQKKLDWMNNVKVMVQRILEGLFPTDCFVFQEFVLSVSFSNFDVFNQ